MTDQMEKELSMGHLSITPSSKWTNATLLPQLPSMLHRLPIRIHWFTWLTSKGTLPLTNLRTSVQLFLESTKGAHGSCMAFLRLNQAFSSILDSLLWRSNTDQAGGLKPHRFIRGLVIQLTANFCKSNVAWAYIVVTDDNIGKRWFSGSSFVCFKCYRGFAQ